MHDNDFTTIKNSSLIFHGEKNCTIVGGHNDVLSAACGNYKKVGWEFIVRFHAFMYQ